MSALRLAPASPCRALLHTRAGVMAFRYASRRLRPAHHAPRWRRTASSRWCRPRPRPWRRADCSATAPAGRAAISSGSTCGARHVVVHERAGQELPAFAVVDAVLAHHLADALHQPAVQLALDDRRGCRSCRSRRPRCSAGCRSCRCRDRSRPRRCGRRSGTPPSTGVVALVSSGCGSVPACFFDQFGQADRVGRCPCTTKAGLS